MGNNLFDKIQNLSELTIYLNSCTPEQLKKIKQKCIEEIITDNETFEKEKENFEKENNTIEETKNLLKV